MSKIKPVLTKAGISAIFNSESTGLKMSVSHIALGDANGKGYTPTDSAATLVNEKARVAIGGGQRVSPHQIQIAALFDNTPNFWVWEAGIFLDDGTLLAVWSDKATPWQYKTNDVPTVIGFDLYVEGLPPDSFDLNISGPSVNIFLSGPLAQLASASLALIRRTVQSENRALLSTIENKWS